MYDVLAGECGDLPFAGSVPDKLYELANIHVALKE